MGREAHREYTHEFVVHPRVERVHRQHFRMSIIFTDSVIVFPQSGGHCGNSVGGSSIDKLKLVGQQQRLRQEFPPGKLIRQRSTKLTGH
jgi:hypothetical protein